MVCRCLLARQARVGRGGFPVKLKFEILRCSHEPGGPNGVPLFAGPSGSRWPSALADKLKFEDEIEQRAVISSRHAVFTPYLLLPLSVCHH